MSKLSLVRGEEPPARLWLVALAARAVAKAAERRGVEASAISDTGASHKGKTGAWLKAVTAARIEVAVELTRLEPDGPSKAECAKAMGAPRDRFYEWLDRANDPERYAGRLRRTAEAR